MSQATTVKEVLTAVEWMLENIGWCRHSFFMDKKGEPYLTAESVLRHHEQLGGMCLAGAFSLVEAAPYLKEDAKQHVRGLLNNRHANSLVCFNDTATKEDVLSVVRKAKEAAK